MNTPIPSPGLLPEAWRVHLPVFDGPLDLLLQLVKVNKVEISDIPVATICDQFHAYLALAEELDLDLAGEYIYEAALLIHLKSRMLLPRTPRGEGETEEDPREELVARLLEYRRLRDAAQSLAEIESVRRGIWRRQGPPPDLGAPPEEEAGEIDLGEVSLYDLLGALRHVLVRYDQAHPPAYHLDLETFSVRDQVRRLLAEIDRGRPFDLLADLRSRSCRSEVIAAFLAVLELARLALVRVHQTTGGEVVLYRTTREVENEELEALSG
ncbi:MAG TPA: segregation/condensation protein A [Thermoanaerobaculia bacterium]|nr:segregation/condensation protein A [Thermoanaerobaculia bacterium]